jgi:cytochrome c peroxidase
MKPVSPTLRSLFSTAAFVLVTSYAGCFACQSQASSNAVLPPEKESTATTEAYRWALPEGFPVPVIPKDNPITAAKVDLGRHLFYDKRLSVDGSLSCASCHEQKRAFSDGKALPEGVHGDVLTRNSMALFNLAYTPILTWANPQLKHLEVQMLIPLFGEDPPELGRVGQEAELLATLAALPLYQQKFAAAFPGNPTPFTLKHLTQALASFERSLISADSPYDRYIYAEDDGAISSAARRGEALFFSERLECFHCHGGFNFSDSTQHAGSTFMEFNFHNTGLYAEYPATGQGLKDVTGRPEDSGKFKAPSLRNIAVTAPYMHDGSVKDLDAVIDHYAAGGRAQHPNKSGFVKGFALSASERADLLAFLESLTDETFLTNPAYSDPFVGY